MPFPLPHRPRRLRPTPALRALVRETTLSPGDFVYPLFFSADRRRAAAHRHDAGRLPAPREGAPPATRKRPQKRGLGGVILFGLPKTKDARGLERPRPRRPRPPRRRGDEGRGRRASS